MRKKVTIVVFLVLLIVVAFSGTPGYAAGESRPQYVEGEVLVKLKEGVSLTQIDAINQRFNTHTLREFDSIRGFHLELPANLSVARAIQVIQRHPYVEYVAPNNLYYLDVMPNDPDFGSMWGLHNTGQTGGTADADIDAPEGWDITTGDSSVVVAVIDSGLDMTHEDLAANLWTNPGEIAGNGIDDDGNGFVDDIHGWDFSSNDNDPSPVGGACGGHGTHTGGTIGAVGDNGVGVTGVNWNVQIMPLKAFKPFLGVFCTANDADLIAAIEYHTMMGVRISSNSWGGGSFSQATYDAIRASKSVFVAAAGNDGTNNDVTPHYPSNYALDNIISVAATTDTDALASFSNFGATSVDLGAPGENILSTLHNNSYGSYSGTSMATPHVAGVAGLLLAQDPNLTNNEIKWRILNGTDNTGLNVLTGGRLNSHGALAWGLSTMAVTIEVTPLGATDVHAGDTVNYQMTATNHDAVSHSVNGMVFARLMDGREIVLGSTTITLAAGQVRSFNLSELVPAAVAPGTTIELFGQVETAVSFDEDVAVYTVIP